MKQIAPVLVLSALVVALPISVAAQTGNLWNTSEATQTEYAPTAPVASPYAPAGLEQQLSSGATWPQETQPEYVQPKAEAAPQFAPLQQEIPAPQYAPMQQQQQFANMQQQQFAPIQQFVGQQPYFGNVPYSYVPKYTYGGYPNVPGGYPGGYPNVNGFNNPYGYGTTMPFLNGFSAFPFNNGGFGNQYGNIPSGTSPFFGGGSSPFGFW